MKVLFFTPYAGRTGSEMFLWYMLSHRNKELIKAALVSESNGELLSEMPDDVKTYTTLRYPGAFYRYAIMIARRFGINFYNKSILRIHNAEKPDCWYLNTVMEADKVLLAERYNIPVIMHFHELTSDFRLVKREIMQKVLSYASACIADSMAVYHKLEVLGARRILLQYECVDIGKIKPRQDQVDNLRKQLGLEQYSFVWLMSGTSISRKGIEFVPELGRLLKERNAALLWLGNNTDSGMDLMIQKELEYQKLENVYFLGKKSTDYYDYMDLMNGFVLLSREEPFGMVAVEALALGKPVVSFKSGGIAEIVTEETGIVVDSWNISDLVIAMNDVADNIARYDVGKLKARASYFDVGHQVRNWETLLKRDIL